MTPTPADLQDLRANLERIYRPEYAHHVHRFNCLDAWLADQIAQAAGARIEFRLVDAALEVAQGAARKRYARPTAGMRAAHAAIASRTPVAVSAFATGPSADDSLRNSIRAAGRAFERDGFDMLAAALQRDRLHVEGGFVVYDPPVNAPVIHV